MLKVRKKLFNFKLETINKPIVVLTAILLLSLLSAACATYKATLKDQAFGGALPDDTYTLIKYGANNSDDFATFVILVPEQGGYAFDIFKPDFEYRTIKGVPAKAAMQMAQDFVSNHPDFLRSSSRTILAPDGSVAGYETRTLYRRTFLGMEDLFYVTYLLKADNRIEVRIKLDDVVLKWLLSDSSN
jgi:hypothetical protein